MDKICSAGVFAPPPETSAQDPPPLDRVKGGSAILSGRERAGNLSKLWSFFRLFFSTWSIYLHERGTFSVFTFEISLSKTFVLSSVYIASPGPTCGNSVFLIFFHSVANFLGFQLVLARVSGSGSGIALFQDIVTSNAGAELILML